MWYPRPVSVSVDHLLDRYDIATITTALRPFLTDRRIERIEQVLDARLGSLTTVIENLHDPHNGAAAIRSMEGFGLQHLHVVEPVEPFAFSAAVTISAEKWITIHRHDSFTACAAALRERGFRLLAMVPRLGHERAVELEAVDVSGPLACVFGNERDGLTEESVGACDVQVTMPMQGFTQSFNLSVSVALVMRELARRRRAEIDADGDLSLQERALLRARWYALSVRHADEILSQRVSGLTQDSVDAVPHSEEKG